MKIGSILEDQLPLLNRRMLTGKFPSLSGRMQQAYRLRSLIQEAYITDFRRRPYDQLGCIIRYRKSRSAPLHCLLVLLFALLWCHTIEGLLEMNAGDLVLLLDPILSCCH